MEFIVILQQIIDFILNGLAAAHSSKQFPWCLFCSNKMHNNFLTSSEKTTKEVDNRKGLFLSITGLALRLGRNITFNHVPVQYSAVHCTTVQYVAVQFSAVQFSAVEQYL